MTIYKIKATTQLKKGILSPENDIIKKTLVRLDYPVTKFATSKSMLVDVEADDAETAIKLVEDMCAKILANPVLHDYSVEVI
jgi:phosphoribosylformylglycinamidine synthase